MKKYIQKIILGAAAAVLLCGAAGLMGGCGEHEHLFGAWTEIKAAGCEENGTRARVCTVCEYTETEDIPAPGHAWGVAKVTKAATCTAGGERTKTCSRCGKEEKTPTDPLDHDWVTVSVLQAPTCTEPGREEQICSMCGEPRTAEVDALGHDWDVPEIVKVVDCENDGLERKTCKRCGTPSGDIVIPALGHQWMNTRVIVPATCEETGTQEQTCGRPGCTVKTRTVEIPALDHAWQDYYTVDVQATFDHAGSKSYHCNRCEKTTGQTEIPQLNINTPIPYEFRTLRNNGQLLIAPTITLIVKDETGAEVARSTPADLNGGVFTKELLPKTYTVTAENIPGGYSCGSSFTVTPFDPYCNVYLTASLREGSPSGRYAVGDVMYNFTAPAANSTAGELSLKNILKTKKMVLLNFWYVECGYCEEEFPALQRAYTKYQSTVEVIGVNQSDAMSAIETYRAQMGLSFPLVQNSAVGLISPFNVTGYPTTVVIDGEGVVCEILIGPQTQAKFEQIFAKYTADGYLRASAPAAAALPLCEALPPQNGKRSGK